jgi:hypothetical protein
MGGNPMAETDVKIVVQIKSYIEQHGGNYPSWYVGLAEHPEEQLISHGVNLDQDPCIFRTATCLEDAKSVKQYFTTHLGTHEDSNSNDNDNALSVYAYKKSRATHP